MVGEVQVGCIQQARIEADYKCAKAYATSSTPNKNIPTQPTISALATFGSPVGKVTGRRTGETHAPFCGLPLAHSHKTLRVHALCRPEPHMSALIPSRTNTLHDNQNSQAWYLLVRTGSI